MKTKDCQKCWKNQEWNLLKQGNIIVNLEKWKRIKEKSTKH